MSFEKSRDQLIISGKSTEERLLLKNRSSKKFFDSNCVKMGVEAVEMD